jgi:predicted nucleic acid-binding protein
VIVLLDNTVLSNFAVVGRPDLVHQVLGDDAATTEAAWEEHQVGVRTERLPAQDWSWLPILPLRESETTLFQQLSQHLNAGEAACLAIAAARGARVMTDDRDAREIAAEWHIPISGTLGLLLRAVDLGILDIVEGDRLLQKMIEIGYHSPVASLRQVQ